jgi:endonuclease/exonuclease/phosphatase family metal-dependent hydrolase
MANWLSKIARFRTLMKVMTIIGLIAMVLSYLAPFFHPNTFKLLPFFGLAYPIIVCCNILSLLYWALVRSKWFFVVLVVLIGGGKLHFRTLAVTYDPELATAEDNTWKILSYNVRLFDVYNESTEGRNRSRDSIVAYIQRMNPDVVCFQEFFQQDKPTQFSTRDTIYDLLQAKGYHERYSHKIRNRQNFGICMISKYPIIAKGDVMFDNFASTDNYCIFADIVKGNDTMRVYNIHLQSIKLEQKEYALFGAKNQEQVVKKSTIRLLIDKLTIAYPARAEQAIKVVEHMQTSPYPVVICGDFNDTPLSYVYNQFNQYLIDSYLETSHGIGATYVGRVPAGRIDYIFHSPVLAAQHFVIQEHAFSDHLAVYCEIWKRKITTP